MPLHVPFAPPSALLGAVGGAVGEVVHGVGALARGGVEGTAANIGRGARAGMAEFALHHLHGDAMRELQRRHSVSQIVEPQARDTESLHESSPHFREAVHVQPPAASVSEARPLAGPPVTRGSAAAAEHGRQPADSVGETHGDRMPGQRGTAA